METGFTSLSARKRRRLSALDYTVACFVAIEVELTVMRAALDTIHDTPDLNYGHSSIAYTCGEIGPHNVVLAVLPRYGNNDSGVVANQLKNDFPSVKNGLLVGIAGGIPDPDSGRDIRLGDVVVSDWKGDLPGVVQFDRGKHQSDGFKRTGYLNHPSDLLLTTVRNLQSQHNQDCINLEILINDMLRRYPGLAQKYLSPSSESDRLYKSDYEHATGITCHMCDNSFVVKRRPRVDSEPQIHYGTFGSSNTVLRNGTERDRLRHDIPGLLAVEMEAAGLMNVLPCVVIKGVCDYADSHKNKQWQPYAAATAAAYAKELLQNMPGAATITYDERYLSRSATLSTLEPDFSASQQALTAQEQTKYEVLSESLTFSRMDARLRNVKDALPKTCRWVRNLPQFKAWINRLELQQNKGFLYIQGKPGCGKSTIMKTTHAWARKTWNNQTIISYFFNARAPGLLEKSSLGLYRSLTYQLLQSIPSTQTSFTRYFASKYRDQETEAWTKEELQSFWNDLVEDLGEEQVNIFIDALDEGNVHDVRQMISFLEDLTEHAYEHGTHLRICLSSRHYPEIRLRHCLSFVMEHEAGHGQDIEAYVKAKLWIDNPQDAENLRQQICKMSSRVFLWVVLVIEILNGSVFKENSEERQRCLEQLPKDLDGLFERIVIRDDVDLGYVDVFLRWMLFSEKPLSRAEIYLATKSSIAAANGTALRIGAGDIPFSAVLDQFILDNSRGLVELTKSTPPVVQFIHETVRTFLLERGIRQIAATQSITSEAQTHDLFAKACLLYLDAYSDHVDVFRKSLDELLVQKSCGEQLSERMSFLKYAATYFLTHAESAQRLGASQEHLLSSLRQNGSRKLTSWIKARNCFQIFVVRQYKTAPPLLYIFAELNLPELCKLCLSHLSSEEIDKVSDARYGTALQAACVGGHEDIVKLLVAQGADLNVAGGEYRHALFAAMFHKKYDLMDWLVQQGAKPRYGSLQRRLFMTIARGMLKGVETLLELGASASNKSARHEMPLRYAIEKGASVQILQALLKAGAIVNEFGVDGLPLQEASLKGQLETVRLLLDAGADVNLRNRDHSTALLAAAREGHFEVARLLLDAGADINQWSGNHGTALRAASGNGHREVVKLLLDSGADFNLQSEYHDTALRTAAGNGHLEVVRLLLDAGADVNLRSRDYSTALQAAAREGHLEVVRLLLDSGADIKLQRSDCYAALQAATYNGHTQIVQLLLSRGVT